MKIKTILAGLAVSLTVQAASATSHYYLNPGKVADMLNQLRQELGEERMQRALGEPVLKSLTEYSRLDNHQIYANAYVAAAAAGAAVAAVEYAWDRYVGNGPKNDRLVPEDYFDINGNPAPRTLIPLAVSLDHYQYPVFGGTPKPFGSNATDPVALTPAVAAATVGALAYKASEYSMKKVFGEYADPEKFDEQSFDLHHQ
ncbi:hypothetical protein EZJ49_03600 [Bdellovibrio bacteriovorus]|uniref:hypothetical protein n=1 Tax=Bdellovibrio bacteriovorus TaxID=959 RepID=UPI0021CE8DD3|nr:hypothetical protein [Bdellovibrio bacteriovorus]UXR65335.1 hypothetical protein EZJ49_03600 [Bdellovibrio bacteriovorus]